jgi:hypothetical protein
MNAADGQQIYDESCLHCRLQPCLLPFSQVLLLTKNLTPNSMYSSIDLKLAVHMLHAVSYTAYVLPSSCCTSS